MTTYESIDINETFNHIPDSPGIKTITQTITIDDGTGKLYDYTLSKEVQWEEYYITPNFFINPEEPSIAQNAEITSEIEDIYDIVEYDYRDLNNPENNISNNQVIDYNFYEDGVSLNNSKNSIINIMLTVPRTQLVSQTTKYFTGWEIKETYLEKEIKKTNLPPEICNTLDSSCYNVPTHLFTSCSTDLEDADPTKLSTIWRLYYDKNCTVQEVYNTTTGRIDKTVMFDEENPDWELVEEHHGFTFYHIYSKQGHYRINETTTDTDGASSNADRYEDITFEKCIEYEKMPEEGVFKGLGEIELEANKWQLIAVPLEYCYWDKDKHEFVRDINQSSNIQNVIIDQIEDRYNMPAKNLFKVANTYIGDLKKSFNYIPGFTKPYSEHNFSLVYRDTDNDSDVPKLKKEIAGIWIKTKNIPFTIKWKIV